METDNRIVKVESRADEVKKLIAVIRIKLAELDAQFTSEKAKLDVFRAKLFHKLRPHFEKRDQLARFLKSRRGVLDGLLAKDAEVVRNAEATYEQDQTESDERYKQAAKDLESKKELSIDEEKEIQALWKKLVRLYHPDRFANDPVKMKAYTQLTAAINAAKENGDLATLREIAADPSAFMAKKGWAHIDLNDTDDPTELEKLYRSLLNETAKVEAELSALRSEPDFALSQEIQRRPEYFEEIVAHRDVGLTREIQKIESELAIVEKSIARANRAH